jgi:hypothetical protein
MKLVTRVSIKGDQSPKQGGVHHMVNPKIKGNWYTSTVTSATSGAYDIELGDDIKAKQIWQFRYNAMACARSMMDNIKLKIEYQYDIKNTKYKTFIN